MILIDDASNKSIIYNALISSSDKPVISNMSAAVNPFDFIFRAISNFSWINFQILQKNKGNTKQRLMDKDSLHCST